MFLTNHPKLNEFRTVIMKRWFVILLGVLLLLLVVGLVARLIAPSFVPEPSVPPPTQQGNPDGSQTEFTDLTFTGTAPAVPEKMWLASVTEYNQSNSQEILDSLVTAYELKPSPHVKNVWNGPEYSLEYDPELNEYRLGKNYTNSKDAPTLISPPALPQLVTQTSKVVESTFTNIPFVSFPEKVELLRGGGEFSPATAVTATHVSVPFGPSFYQIPVILQYDRALPMTVIVDAAGTVIKLVARPFSAEFKASTQHYSLSVQEALAEIERGNASIIESYSETTVVPKLNKVVRGEFTEASLEYRLDPETNQLVPYYHFVGTLVNYDNDIFTADVITPAVRLDE